MGGGHLCLLLMCRCKLIKLAADEQQESIQSSPRRPPAVLAEPVDIKADLEYIFFSPADAGRLDFYKVSQLHIFISRLAAAVPRRRKKPLMFLPGSFLLTSGRK